MHLSHERPVALECGWVIGRVNSVIRRLWAECYLAPRKPRCPSIAKVGFEILWIWEWERRWYDTPSMPRWVIHVPHHYSDSLIALGDTVGQYCLNPVTYSGLMVRSHD